MPITTVIFVFGSNRQGRHGKGAALIAISKYGAKYGQAEGRQGRSYAIITKELRKHKKKVTLEEIKAGVKRFIKYAKKRPELTFNLTAVGCGNAGRTPRQIGPMFKGSPKNVILPKEFVKYCRTLEERFLFAWRKRYGHLPQPKRQYVFHPTREWPFDFAWPKYKLAVEIHGGSFIFGGHNRGKSQANDFEKANHAVQLGWRLLAFNTFQLGQVEDGKLWDCVDFTAAVLTNARDI